MNKLPLDIYDDMPRAMRKYISNYGWHFNKEACEYAVSSMRKKNNEKITMQTKEQVEQILKKYAVSLDNNTLYDAVFTYHMGLADYFGSSIKDEQHLALYVKDTIDDVDASPETTFRRWAATQVGNGEPIPWSNFI